MDFIGTLEIERTIDDSKAYTKPWSIKVTQIIASDTELLDYIGIPTGWPSLRLCRYFEASLGARFRGFSDDIDLMGVAADDVKVRWLPYRSATRTEFGSPGWPAPIV